jgi:predicted small metal-binding protein
MTCKQLGGACDYKISGKTFDEIAKKAQEHGSEMASKGEESHLEVMDKMREMMVDPNAMKAWMEDKKQEFDDLPEDE